MKKVILMLIALFLFADPPWAPDVAVSQDPGTGNQNETTNAVWNDSLVCGGWNDSRLGAYHVGFAASTDYGVTWQETLMFEPSYNSDCDPCIVVNDSGTICYVWLSYDPSQFVGDVYVTKSADWGQTWGPSICVTTNTPTTLDDKCWGACDGNNMYVTWKAFMGASGIRFKRSTDWGQTWGSDVVVGQNGNGSIPFRGIDSIIHVGWGYQDLRLSTSTDMGQTWTGERVIISCPWNPPGTPFRINNIPCYTTSHDRSVLYVIFTDSRHQSGQLDISFSRSTDQGTTWMTPVKVNDTGGGDMSLQFYPWMDVDPNGNLHAIWHDSRNGTIRDLAQYYSYSTDGGLTWSPNEKVSDVVANTGTFIGDYNAIAADASDIYGLWCDARTSSTNPDVFSSRRTNDIAVRERMSVSSPRPELILSFPNPFTSRSTIKIMPEDANLQIYQADGRRVERLDAIGVYFLVLEKGNQSMTKKLVKIE